MEGESSGLMGMQDWIYDQTDKLAGPEVPGIGLGGQDGGNRST